MRDLTLVWVVVKVTGQSEQLIGVFSTAEKAQGYVDSLIERAGMAYSSWFRKGESRIRHNGGGQYVVDPEFIDGLIRETT